MDPGLVIAIAQEAEKEIEAVRTEIDRAIERREAEAQRASDARAFLAVVSESFYIEVNRVAASKKIRPFNLAICDAANRCELQSDDGLHYYRKSVIYKDRTYTIFAFRGGVLINHGSNGWDQWIVKGCHDLSSGTGQKEVRFANTGWIGPIEHVNPGCNRG